MRCQHYYGLTTEDKLVVASSSGKQHKWQRGFEAHQTSCIHQPHMFTNDLCRPDDTGITFKENASAHVLLFRVGDYLHVGE